MAAELDHVRLANRNHEALLHLLHDVDRFPEWVATVAFYKAVHIAEALLASDAGRHSPSHLERERSLKTTRYAAVYRDYARLLSASRIARYLQDGDGPGFRSFEDYMGAADVRDRLVKRFLFGVEQKSLPFLSPAAVSLLAKVDPGSL